TAGKRALYDNLDKNEGLALAVDEAVRASRQDDWRSNPFKVKRVKHAIKAALESVLEEGGLTSSDRTAGQSREHNATYKTEANESLEDRLERVLALVQNQDEY